MARAGRVPVLGAGGLRLAAAHPLRSGTARALPNRGMLAQVAGARGSLAGGSGRGQVALRGVGRRQAAHACPVVCEWLLLVVSPLIVAPTLSACSDAQAGARGTSCLLPATSVVQHDLVRGRAGLKGFHLRGSYISIEDDRRYAMITVQAFQPADP
jgi:hypothetical protein